VRRARTRVCTRQFGPSPGPDGPRWNPPTLREASLFCPEDGIDCREATSDKLEAVINFREVFVDTGEGALDEVQAVAMQLRSAAVPGRSKVESLKAPDCTR
jgi:hypothetical protein